MKKLRLPLLLGLCVHLYSIWSWTSCKIAPEELSALQKAQTEITSSLRRNHEAFARSLENISQKHLQKGNVSKLALKSDLQKIARIFRARGERAEELNHRLEKATAELCR